MGENTKTEIDAGEVEEQAMHIKGAIEALMFVSEKPVALDQIKKALQTVSMAEIKKAIND